MNQRQKLVLAVGLAVFVVAGSLVVPYSYAPGRGFTLATSVGRCGSTARLSAKDRSPPR